MKHYRYHNNIDTHSLTILSPKVASVHFVQLLTLYQRALVLAANLQSHQLKQKKERAKLKGSLQSSKLRNHKEEKFRIQERYWTISANVLNHRSRGSLGP